MSNKPPTPSSFPLRPSSWSGMRSKPAHQALDASDFLRRNSKMASLLPAATRMMALQKDCLAVLPVMFQDCEVLRFESGLLLIAVSTTALATKLKQQLPKLQYDLSQRGWQVTSIRIKVQVKAKIDDKIMGQGHELPPLALQAFAELEQSLSNHPSERDLKAAVRELLAKRRTPPQE